MDNNSQTPALEEVNRERRGHAFYPPNTENIPGIYETEGKDKIVHLHYFVGGADWWITELDPKTGEAYGYCRILGLGDGEWGYVALEELEAVVAPRGFIVERDLDWTPTPWSEVEKNL